MKMAMVMVLVLLCAEHIAWSDPIENGTRNVFGRTSSTATSVFNLGVSPSSVVTVRYLQRNLTGDGYGMARRATDGTAVHVQIVAYDEAGRIIDNFGLTGEETSLSLQKATIEIERKSDILGKYDQKPLGERKMSAEAYVRARNRTEQMALYYSPLNSVHLDTAIATDAALGAMVAGANAGASDAVVGAMYGAGVGAKRAVAEYHQAGRYNLAVASDTSQQMSFAGMNCQYLPVLFEQNSNEEPTLVIVQPYSQPGEDSTSRIAELETPVAPSGVVNADNFVPPDSSQPVQTSSGTVNTAPAYQTQTIDNTAAKAQFSEMLEGAYQHASGIAAEAGVAAEYQSAVAPVMSQGREAISSIPDQQTIMMPVGTTSSGGYSSEIMDQVGRTFSEQGPCSAGFQLETLKNQPQTP